MVSALIVNVHIEDCLLCRKTAWTKANILQVNYSTQKPACVPREGHFSGEAHTNQQPWLSHQTTGLSCSPAASVFQNAWALHISIMYSSHMKKTSGHNSWWDFHRVCPSAQSTNKRCLTTKTFRCHQQNTANSYTVFIRRYSYAAFELISPKKKF